MIQFNEETHTYTVDGAVLPSVTQVMSPLNDFDMIPKPVLEKAGRFGSAVHKACALWLDGELDEDTIDPNLIKPLDAFKDFFTNHLPDAPAIIDIKTRKYDPTKDPIQLAAYEKMFIEFSKTNSPDDITIEKPMFHKRLHYAGTSDIVLNGSGNFKHYVLQLTQDGKPILTHARDKQAWSKFRFLLDHFYHMNKFEENLVLWKTKK